MEIIAKQVPGMREGLVEPVLVDVPVLHNGRQIGNAEVNTRGEIVISVKDPFDQNGIFRVLANHEFSAITFGVAP